MIRFLKQNFIIVLILLILVIFLQYLLLQPNFKIGLSYADWFYLDYYRLLGDNPLFKIFYVIKRAGPYYMQEIWVGTLVDIFGWQNQVILKGVNIAIKIIETLLIFPVVLLIFKRKLLAILATLIFAMHYGATGNLEDFVGGVDYFVGLFLLIFVAVYYHVVKNEQILSFRNKILSLKWLGLLFLSLTATIFSIPVRSFPVLVLPFLIEFLLLTHDHSKTSFKNSFFRLLTLFPAYLLGIMIFVFPVGITSPAIGVRPPLISYILRGDWYFALQPLAGLSTIFIPAEYLSKVFGSQTLNPNNLFINYLWFLIRIPLIYFGMLTYLLSFFIKPSWLGRWKFVLITLVLNFTLEIVVFFIYNIRYNYPPNYQNVSELAGLYPIFTGIFLLILSFWAFYGWLKGGIKNNLLWAFCSGIIFAFIFLVLTRLETGDSFGYTAVHRYFTAAALGASLSFASLLILFYDKITFRTSKLSRLFSGILIFLVLVVFYNISNQQISDYFNSQITIGRSIESREVMHRRFLEKFSKYNYDPEKTSLFYFDSSEESNTDGYFLSESFQSHFMAWFHLRSPKLVKGCIQDTGGTIDDLKKLIKVKDEVKGIEYKAFCINPNDGTYDSIQTLFLPENIYAFKVKNREFYDNREEVLKELGFD